MSSRSRPERRRRRSPDAVPAAARAAAADVRVSRGFPPVLGPAPRVLVLGSLPGRASLAAGEYYAQPRNAFWRIMGELCGAGPGLDYPARLDRLRAAGIALWDVLAAAERPGSLDADIVTASEEPNDIAALIEREATIALVACNGRKAATSFARRVAPALGTRPIELVVLPSTSPAHAALRFETKLARWRAALAPCLRAG